jgi:hypothetical protein
MGFKRCSLTGVKAAFAAATNLALLRLEAGIRLVDDVYNALAAYDLAIAMATLERLERATDFHWFSPDLWNGG